MSVGIKWTASELDRNGGHSPECEQACDPSCPIGIERKFEADRRAYDAQILWARQERLTESEQRLMDGNR